MPYTMEPESHFRAPTKGSSAIHVKVGMWPTCGTGVTGHESMLRIYLHGGGCGDRQDKMG